MEEGYSKSKSGRRYYDRRNRKGKFIKKTQAQIEYNIQQPDYPEYVYNKYNRRWEHILYRACVCLNRFPNHSTIQRPNYTNYTYVKIDYIENISLNDMQEKLMIELGKKLHFDPRDLWIDRSEGFDIEYPKPYYGKNRPYEGFDIVDIGDVY
jgi:hypothetical protein